MSKQKHDKKIKNYYPTYMCVPTCPGVYDKNYEVYKCSEIQWKRYGKNNSNQQIGSICNVQ